MVRSLLIVIMLIFTACASTTTKAVPTTSPPTVTLIVATQTPIPPTVTLAQPSPTAKFWISKRGYHAAAYDSQCDRVIVQGGETNSDYIYNGLNDTWIYDIAHNKWTKMSPSRSPDIGQGSMAFDNAANLSIFYIGEINAPDQPFFLGPANQTWAYDCKRNTWTNLNAKDAPNGLLEAGMAYDSKADRMILFGGLNLPMSSDGSYTYSDETWAYDYQTNTWTDLHPKISPPGLNGFSMIYDEFSDRVLAWIQPENDGTNAIWEYDYTKNTWTPHHMDKPGFVVSSGAAYVPTIKKTFFFGGISVPSETPNNDMWTYDSATNTWAQISASNGPGPRGWATLSYSPKADKLVLIGGGENRDTFTSEVWIYDPDQRSWTKAGP